jgi:RNA polymerase subunit RPABC4/transcription elongation factor Spt4
LNLTENLGKSFDYTKKMLSDVGRLIILIVFDVIPIVNWIVIGYAARVLRESPSSDVPPRLERYGEMFVDGAKVFFASLIYMIIPVILIAAGIASFFMNVSVQGPPNLLISRPGAMIFGGTGIAMVLLGLLLAFFFLLILSVGMAHMIRTAKFGKAFALGEIFGVIHGIGWVRYIGWAVLVFVIAVLVGGVAGAIPYVGWLISIVISPLLTVFIFRSLGLLYNEGAPAELRTQTIPTVAVGIACQSCGTSLQPNQKFCPNCGAPAPTPAPPAASEGKFCINCGARLPAGASFCGNCGAKQS